MRIRIPTGLRTLSLTAQRKGLVQYRCTKCGQVHLQEMEIQTVQAAQYHAFGGEKARQNAENKVRQMAADALEKRDAELFAAINLQRDYTKIYAPIVCPNCGETQCWSQIPKPWKQAKGFGLWVFGIAVFGIDSLVMTLYSGWMGLMFLPFLLLLLTLPLIRSSKRKKALAAVQAVGFYPPRYFNHTNLHEFSAYGTAQPASGNANA